MQCQFVFIHWISMTEMEMALRLPLPTVPDILPKCQQWVLPLLDGPMHVMALGTGQQHEKKWLGTECSPSCDRGQTRATGIAMRYFRLNGIKWRNWNWNYYTWFASTVYQMCIAYGHFKRNIWKMLPRYGYTSLPLPAPWNVNGTKHVRSKGHSEDSWNRLALECPSDTLCWFQPSRSPGGKFGLLRSAKWRCPLDEGGRYFTFLSQLV